jgi:hypothetical protein
MTWSEILVRGNKQNHLVRTASLCPEARARLAELRLDDIERLLALHLSGTERVWGIFTKGILTVLWWDPDHKVYPSHLKHT